MTIKLSCLVLLSVTLVACEKKESPSPTVSATPTASAPEKKALTGDVLSGSSGSAAQVRLGGAMKGGKLPFDILEVHDNVAATDAAPWWKPNGEWTVLDAKTEDGIVMTLGLKVRLKLQSDPPMTLVDGFVATKSNADGERLVASLARALGTAAPPPASDKKPAALLEVNAVNLSEDAVRNADGSFSGTGGGWVASKWTFEAPGADNGEIYFNYSLTAKKGELSRKDERYDPDVVKFFARALRDGAPLAPMTIGSAPKPPAKSKP